VSLKVFAAAALLGFLGAAWGDQAREVPPVAPEVPGAARLLSLVEDVAEEYAESHETTPEAAIAVAAFADDARALALEVPRRATGARAPNRWRAPSALRPPVESGRPVPRSPPTSWARE
jgi:hypothetical protein